MSTLQPPQRVARLFLLLQLPKRIQIAEWIVDLLFYDGTCCLRIFHLIRRHYATCTERTFELIHTSSQIKSFDNLRLLSSSWALHSTICIDSSRVTISRKTPFRCEEMRNHTSTASGKFMNKLKLFVVFGLVFLNRRTYLSEKVVLSCWPGQPQSPTPPVRNALNQIYSSE